MEHYIRTRKAAAWLVLTAALTVVLAPASAQRGGFGLDPRAEDRSYHFADTDEQMQYCVFVSSKAAENTPAPLIISLHGLGAGPQIMCNSTAVDLAEERGYILAAPMGYNTRGWYGSPLLRGGPRGSNGGGNEPENLSELSEKDVMNVLAMMREEFNVDPDRIYLTGHSMGGAGTLYLGAKHAETWAAIAPVAPAAFGMTDNRRQILQDLEDAGVPVLIVHGDEDEAVPVDLARTWAATMEELGMDHAYEELPGVTHGPVITVSQEYVYDFFDRYSR